MRHFPFGFLTRTTLASHVVYRASSTKLAFFNFFASALAACRRSSPSFYFFWEISLASLKTESLCDVTLGWTLGRSIAVHVNKSALSESSFSNCRSSSAWKDVPICKKWSGCARGIADSLLLVPLWT